VSDYSFEKLNYLIRPTKQIERKLFIEAFHHLARGGFPISDYTYVGFGSVYYADFILFHKYLYMNKMICAEWSDIPKRMRFNKPYDFITLKMRPASEIAGRLNSSTKYLVWLDYDRGLDRENLDDINLFCGALAPESILIVTVDAEPRLPRDIDSESLSARARERLLLQLYREWYDPLLVDPIRASDLSRNDLPVLLAKTMRSQMQSSLVARDLWLEQLFNYRYADGAQMLTLGGMVGNLEVQRKLRATGIFNADYVQRRAKPKAISVPPLTMREKQWIDSRIDQRLTVDNLAFELSGQHLKNYQRYYKHYPLYYESLV
jgi:hypothetical protein